MNSSCSFESLCLSLSNFQVSTFHIYKKYLVSLALQFCKNIQLGYECQQYLVLPIKPNTISVLFYLLFHEEKNANRALITNLAYDVSNPCHTTKTSIFGAAISPFHRQQELQVDTVEVPCCHGGRIG